MKWQIFRTCAAPALVLALCWTIASGAALAETTRFACRSTHASEQDAVPRPAPSGFPSVTPAVWSLVQAPLAPVRGSDGRFHLVYELLFTNLASVAVSIDEVVVVNPARESEPVGENLVLDAQGRDVTAKPRPFGVSPEPGQSGFTGSLGPGQAGLMFFDVTFAREEDIPATIAHRVTQSLPGAAGSQPITAVGDAVPVCAADDAVLVVRPPLRGNHWINGNGCCAVVSSHRGAVLPLDGGLRPAQHYAIDFVQLNQAGRAWEGDPREVANWIGYGAPIHSATAGRVVSARDGLADQPVGGLPPDLPVADALGNGVIVDIGGGRYAAYAHMAPGSVSVKAGDQVQVGTVLGALGNSGNSSAPHLHFHVMDRPSVLVANGLPYVFDHWTLERRVTGTTLDALESAIDGGQTLPSTSSGRGRRTQEMPLLFDIASFR
jgi:hypothetical protein